METNISGYKICEIHSLGELHDEIGKSTTDWPITWFRGVCGDYPLLPSVLRDSAVDEELITKNFRRLAPSLLPSLKPHDPVNTLTFAQHYRLPTRLLDWSESLSVAIYFALEGHSKRLTAGKRSRDLDVFIWCLDPGLLNLLSRTQFVSTEKPERHRILMELREESFEDKWTPMYFDDDRIRDYANISFGNTSEDGNDSSGQSMKYPVCFNPEGIHQRIHSQQSCFCIHGMEDDPLDVQLSWLTSDLAGLPLRGFRIPASSMSRLKADFRRLGPSAQTIYCDIDGLVMDLVKSR